MYQPWLLLVELAVLAATLYFFGMTRQAATANRQQIEELVIKRANERIEAHNTAMARDVATLVKEIEDTAAEMRAQWERYSVMLEDGLKRVEALEETRLQLSPPKPSAPPETVSAPQNSVSGKTLGEALAEYRQHLSGTTRSAASINRAYGYVVAFARWRDGKRYERVQLHRITATDVDNYADELASQGLRPDTIRRKLNAVREFMAWLVEKLQTPTRPAASPSPPPRLDRRKIVETLAQQGLDIQTIAAKTGMERETVRIILQAEN